MHIYNKNGGIFMENVFNVKYNTKLDRLEMPKERVTHKVFKFLENHKFISVIFTSFIILSVINFYLIYSFMKILENI